MLGFIFYIPVFSVWYELHSITMFSLHLCTPALLKLFLVQTSDQINWDLMACSDIT